LTGMWTNWYTILHAKSNGYTFQLKSVLWPCIFCLKKWSSPPPCCFCWHS